MSYTGPKYPAVNDGDRYEDKDPRSGNRVIRILSNYVRQGVGHKEARVTYVVEVSEFLPHAVGRHGTMSLRNLVNRYRKISH